MLTVDWETRFREVFDQAVRDYRQGRRGADGLFDAEARAFLGEIGATAQEIYDFVEDWCELGEPTPEVAVKLAGIRRNYLLSEQGGKAGEAPWPAERFPGRNAELGGFRWLPRILAKARAKLRGCLPPDLMYGCGGDRAFLREVGMDPVEFLRAVWSAGDDDAPVLELVRRRAARTGRPGDFGGVAG